MKLTEKQEERFYAKVHFKSGCWPWLSDVTRAGYGRITIDYKRYMAHRVAYELWVGPIPEGLQLDHLCRNPSCVNPLHLEPVTPRENLMRGETLASANAVKTHCPQGHSYDEMNTELRAGRRFCRECRRTKAREYQRRMAAKKKVA